MSRKLALIIGNGEYDDTGLARLASPDVDVRALADLLQAPEIGGFDEVQTLVNQPFADAQPAIADFFAEKKPDDLLLLYFSGHGVLDDQGRLYLAVKNTRRNRVSGTAVSATFIADEMNSSRSRRQVLILDCCHSGAFARGAKGATGARAVTRATFEGGYGRVVLTATDATQYAWEGDQVIGQAEKSVFTHYLIQGLQTGEADANGDGQITLDEWYDYVYEQVRSKTAKQTPSKFSYREQGDIVIARNPHPVVKPASLPAGLQEDIADPRPWVREGAVQELDRLLQGHDPGLARAALEALKRLAKDDSRLVSAASAQVLATYMARQRTLEQAKAEPPGRETQPAEQEEPALKPARPDAELPAAPLAEAQRTSWIGAALGGRYQVQALLGQGGMSAVYKAADPNLRRTVAIKLIHPHLSGDPEFVRRFEQEAAAVAKLRHPNIIQVFDFAHEGEVYYMVLEYLEGETLRTRLEALKASDHWLPLTEALRIMATICDAVAYAHRHGLIHRDLKPGNVMLDAQGQPILMDFGVAKILGGEQHTATGVVLGTVAYMSPEQVRGERPDERADLYSLGVMLYELTARHPPFEAASALTVMMKHLNDPVPDVRQDSPDVPDDLAAMIAKALAKDPAERFQTATEMAAALRAISEALTREQARAAEEQRARERAEADRLAARKAEEDRIARERAEEERLAREKAEQEWLAREQAEQERRAREAEQAEAERKAIEEAERLAAHAKRVEQERLARAAERTEQERLVREKVEQERRARAAERAEKERRSRANAEQERLARAAEWAEKARLVREKLKANGLTVAVVTLVVLGLGLGLFRVIARQSQASLPPGEGMEVIPGGPYTVGRVSSDTQHYAPPKQVEVSEFWIDKFEVTNEGYASFLEATGSSLPATRPGEANHPVRGVTWDQANDYCEWAKKRLPTEAEWEVAARGPEGLLYPWGDDEQAVALPREGTYPVGSRADNVSPFGIYDMAGNVWEWVGEPYATLEAGRQILRGGGYGFLRDMAYRADVDPGVLTSIATAGIRCAADRVGENR